MLIEPNYYVKLVAVQKINKENNVLEDYKKDDWRLKFVGYFGNLEFRYYSKAFSFKAETERKKSIDEDLGEYETEDLFSTTIRNIEECDSNLFITIDNTLYTFEISSKSPKENTQAYFNYLMSK